MTDREIIFRKWSSRIRTADEQEYLDYVARTGASNYRSTTGNLGYQILVRTLGDGTSEVTTLSWWKDMEAIRAFAGPEPELSRYYPEDGRTCSITPNSSSTTGSSPAKSACRATRAAELPIARRPNRGRQAARSITALAPSAFAQWAQQ